MILCIRCVWANKYAFAGFALLVAAYGIQFGYAPMSDALRIICFVAAGMLNMAGTSLLVLTGFAILTTREAYLRVYRPFQRSRKVGGHLVLGQARKGYCYAKGVRLAINDIAQKLREEQLRGT